ncbi:MAG TPA: hypothetical protein PLN94_05225, partial [Thiolinea sp.]|nr:hypothetical protein [Thiolinea sp.]
DGCYAQGNLIAQCRHGIWLAGAGCRADENHVIACCGDHVRYTRNGTDVKHNVLLESWQGHPHNHNDFIQGWDATAEMPEQGTLYDCMVSGNLLRNGTGAYCIPAQGIGMFDGLASHITVMDNVVVTDHVLGICMGHVDACVISGNRVFGLQGVAAGIRVRTGKAALYARTAIRPSRVAGNQAAAYDLAPGLPLEQEVEHG